MDLHRAQALGELTGSALGDGPRHYGLASIALHWTSAAVILALLFLGGSMTFGQPLDVLHLHTSIALSAWGLLAARIGWRVVHGHPRPPPRQKRVGYAIARWFHMALLMALAAMLVSGPLAAWSSGLPLDLWAWRVPAPFAPDAALFALAHRVHHFCADCLGWGALVHMVAVAKHVAVDRDGSFEKMLVPTSEPPGPG